MAADGDWTLTIETPMGPQEAKLTVKSTSATAFDGVLDGQSGRQEFEGTIEGGDTLVWTTDITVPVPLSIGFSVKIEGDALNGSAQLGMFGSANVTGVRA